MVRSVKSPLMLLCAIMIMTDAAHALVRSEDAAAAGAAAVTNSTFSGVVQGQSGAAGQQQPGQNPGQQQQQDSSSGAAKKPAAGGKIGSNVQQVNQILNPDKKDEKKDAAYSEPEPMTIEDTAGLIMDISINSFTAYCACPYSRNSDGFECGVEAAYYKPGGYRLKCYPQDIRGQEYIFYRKNH